MFAAKSCSRRRLLLGAITLLAVVFGGGAIEWSESVSSSSSDIPYTPNIGEMITIVIAPKDRANIDVVSNVSNHFSVSFRQCSTTEAPQPMQLQYKDVLNYDPSLAGCIFAENELAGITDTACIFWEYNPFVTWITSGYIYENRYPLEPERVRIENTGTKNATVNVVMFSAEVTPPEGIVNSNVWIDEIFVKKDRVVNTSISVYFNNVDNHCENYGCTVSGYMNEYVEDQDSLSLCEVKTVEPLYEDLEYKNPINMIFELPAASEYYVTIILTASEHAAVNITEMQKYGLDEVIVFQTDSTQPDNSARELLASLSLASLAWIAILNMLLAASGPQALWPGRHFFPDLGW